MNIKDYLSSSDLEVILDIVKRLSTKVASFNLESGESWGLFNGIAGHLLFLYNAHAFDNNMVAEEVLFSRFSLIQEQFNEKDFSFGSGLAGQIWLLEYINQKNFEEYDSESMEYFDKLVNSLFCKFKEIEFVNGLAGIAPYSIRRIHHDSSNLLYENYINCMISRADMFTNGGISWSQPPGSLYRFNYEGDSSAEYNLGHAHGVPGILATLIPALDISTVSGLALPIVRKTCKWLFEQQSEDIASISSFSYCAGQSYNSRLGWCYGDLSIALTLARVGEKLHNKKYLNSAKMIGLHSINRDFQSALIKDSSICHGYLGLLLILVRLNKIIPDDRFIKVIVNLIKLSINEYSVKGLKAFYSYNNTSFLYEEDFNFLMGYSGAGLVFLSVLSNFEADWFDSLLI